MENAGNWKAGPCDRPSSLRDAAPSPAAQCPQRKIEVEPLPAPVRRRCPRIDVEPDIVMLIKQTENRIFRQPRRRRHVHQRPPIRPREAYVACCSHHHSEFLLVHSPVVYAAQQRGVRQLRRPAIRPVHDVMHVADLQPASRKAAAAVPVFERAANRRWHGAAAPADVQDLTILAGHHHDAVGIA